MEHTITPLDHHNFLALRTPAAAHQIATINPLRGDVTLTTMRALYAQFGVALAEWWGGLVVDEVLQVGRFVLRIVRLQLEVVFVAADARFTFAVNAVADAVADFLNLRKENMGFRFSF